MPSATPRRRIKPAHLIIVLPVLLVSGAIIWFFVLPFIWYLGYEPREGDVLFQSLPRGSLVNAIEGATHSPWSHCGIVAREDGRWVVYEALGSVRKVSLFSFWRRSRMSTFAVYRWRDEHHDQVAKVLECVQPYMGRPYDARYRMDDEKIYCSELIYKAYRDATGQTMGQLVRLGDLDWQPYERLIRELERGPVPLDREMITPLHLSQATQLEHVRSYRVP